MAGLCVLSAGAWRVSDGRGLLGMGQLVDSRLPCPYAMLSGSLLF